MGQCSSGLGLIYTNLNAYGGPGSSKPPKYTPKWLFLGQFGSNFSQFWDFNAHNATWEGCGIVWDIVPMVWNHLGSTWTPLGPLGAWKPPKWLFFFRKSAQLPNTLSSFVKDEMAWKQFFSVILMYILRWRSGILAAHTPMTTLQFSENSQNGHF